MGCDKDKGHLDAPASAVVHGARVRGATSLAPRMPVSVCKKAAPVAESCASRRLVRQAKSVA
eukprot:12883226-Alexandrium_andersonii.AAC.1